MRRVRAGRHVRTSRGVASIAPAVAAALTALVSPSASLAQTAECLDLLDTMCFPGLPSDRVGGVFWGVSGDGKVVVGNLQDTMRMHAARWSPEAGWDPLGLPGVFSEAYAASQSGSVIVGAFWAPFSHAFRWEGGEFIDLGPGAAHDLSADGRYIAGMLTVAGSNRAIRWDGAEARDLGTLKADNSGQSWAKTISADGSVVAGLSENDQGRIRAFIWGEANGMTALPTAISDDEMPNVWGISADGRVVVGDIQVIGNFAVKWEDESVHRLETLIEGSTLSGARAVSQDGSVIVGFADTEDFTVHAVRWTEDGIEDIHTIESAIASFATGISDDGSTIVGYFSELEGDRPFIWRTEMQDWGKVLQSVHAMADANAIAADAGQHAVATLARNGFLVEQGRGGMRLAGDLFWSGSDEGQGIGSGDGRSGVLSFGYGLSDQVTLGASVAVFGARVGTDAFSNRTGHGAALWGELSETGMDRRGWQASFAAGWGRQGADVTRGLGFENIMLASGKADLDTGVLHAALGYGFQTGSWLVTPSARVSHVRTERSAYSETGSDTLASYEKLRLNRTTLTAKVEAETKVTEFGRLSFGVGVEHDVRADRAGISGSSDIPGFEEFFLESGIRTHRTRGFATAGYRHDLSVDSTMFIDVRAGQSRLGGRGEAGVSVGYQLRF